MKRTILLFYLFFFLFAVAFASARTEVQPTIYVDKQGVMRWSNDHREASFFGVNYTLPFAHSYRTINYLGKNHKKAIDEDVYHFARLGINAYRIHIWDVEISDAKGNLIQNDHLDLLDYLISKLRERNIRVLITTMTNFGDGYPERNEKTDGFSYLYNKCDLHTNPQAIAAQENYISQLIRHVNRYTKEAYKDDPYIIGFEINNEPCHANDQPKDIKNYIDGMLAAMKKAGNKKPVFYNVSQDQAHMDVCFNTPIQGTTYQWYPIGLVAGHTRKGNFLPFVDSYTIPFSTVKGFDNKAKIIYEFDPADISYSYMYPAMARTFRSSGFQWITQFAYDAMDIAASNTDYQTHYMNLAYTPSKAISLKIAAQAAYDIPRNKKFEKYPNDTVFGDFKISYNRNLSELNSPEKYFYSNSTSDEPVKPAQLSAIAGVGSSPIVDYDGMGAYFLDKLQDGLWRLEVMPDAIQVSDPYAKASLKKDVVTIVWNRWKMKIKLSDLGNNFTIKGINEKNDFDSTSSNGSFQITPGVYLLQKTGCPLKKSWDAATRWENIKLGEFVAPKSSPTSFYVNHQPSKIIQNNRDFDVYATIVGATSPDSVLIYTDQVSFWSDKNPIYRMHRILGYTYKGVIPVDALKSNFLRYNIVVFKSGKCQTFPGNVNGNPLDWDYISEKFFESKVVDAGSPLILSEVDEGSNNNMETYGIPSKSYLTAQLVRKGVNDLYRVQYTFHENDSASLFYWKKYIKDEVCNRKGTLAQSKVLYVTIKSPIKVSHLKVGFVTSDGFTYATKLDLNDSQTEYKIPLGKLKQVETTLIPAPYPVFLKRFFQPDVEIPFDIRKIEFIVLNTVDPVSDGASIELGNMWLQKDN